MKVTVRTIAKIAGVSPASVSLVLNNKPCRISEETRERILKTAHENGYELPLKKKKQSNYQEKIIGMIHQGESRSIHEKCIEGIETSATLNGYRIIYCNAGESVEKSIECISVLQELDVLGLIMIPPIGMNESGNAELLGKALREMRTPFLLLDRAINQVFCDFVTSDNKSGMSMAVEYMIEMGHKRIGLIAGKNGVYNTRKRLEGYKEALDFYSVPHGDEDVFYGDYQRSGGYEGAKYFWEKGIKAICVMSDEMAVGVYEYARENNLQIGSDISLVGFDDSLICEILSPGLTSVRQESLLMGKKACEVMIERITGQNQEAPQNNYFVPTLTVRESVCRVEQ